VGIVALPLAMAFAIASGVKPEAGLFTAIIAGFLISALGGSNVQIGGPAGAFIVIVYGIVDRYGLANLLIATSLAGVLLFAMGLFKLGALVRFIPVSIVIGFTNGIAVLIGLSQFKDALGLPIAKMPGDFFAQLHTLGQHLGQTNPWALALTGAAWPWWSSGPRATPCRWACAWAGTTACGAWPPTCRARWWPWWGPRCSRAGCTCRWRPSAAASAASPRVCRASPCRPCPGTAPSSCSFPR
jgi:MFS superfamily sulfate permease-like transporter